LKDNFEITGLFYEIDRYKFRKYLDIKRKGSNQLDPDLMVVMMNPGSSFPLDGVDNNSMPSLAKPDKTQDQIMRVMEKASLNYARILNLSDLRTPDSNELYKFLKSEQSEKVDHSIFYPSRKEDLDGLFIQNVPVIFGWGVNEVLIPLAKMAVNALHIENPLGKLKADTVYSYYHPLPQNHYAQQEWAQYVSNQLVRSSGSL